MWSASHVREGFGLAEMNIDMAFNTTVQVPCAGTGTSYAKTCPRLPDAIQHDASRNYVRHDALGNQKVFVRENKVCQDH
jgi:hypothetical protein